MKREHPKPWSGHIERESGVDTYYVLDANESFVTEFRRKPGQTVDECRAQLAKVVSGELQPNWIW